jgi:uncharacterized protein YgbK (DUF1537 family)
VPLYTLGSGQEADSAELEALEADASTALSRDGVLLLNTATSGLTARRPDEDRGPAEVLATVAARLLRAGLAGGVVASGGDTVAALCRALGGGQLELKGEILPGMPCARLLDGELPGLPIVTKAGGFGPVDALVRAIRSLRGEG